jgi:hypothetical protein
MIFDFNTLRHRLFFKQSHEGTENKGKISGVEMFSPHLSPDSVEMFSLAAGPATVQPDMRIR